MYRHLAFVAVAVCTLGSLTVAQTPVTSKAPFTAQDAVRGLEFAKKSWELRGQVRNGLTPVEPFKIAGNLYHIGVRNGDTLLLTSPQGHIMIGGGFGSPVAEVEKNIEKLGFKVADVKAILMNHSHPNQTGGAAYFREKTGAQTMAGIADVGAIERGMGPGGAGRGGAGAPGAPGGRGGAGAPGAPGMPGGREGGMPGGPGMPGGGRPGGPPPAGGAEPSVFGPFPFIDPSMMGAGGAPVKVDRALFDGDVIRVGPLAVTAYSNPIHTLGATLFAFTVREGGRDLKVAQYCCWELGPDFSNNPNVSDAVFLKLQEMHRKLLPVDIYLESGTYGWGGMVNQPSGTFDERFAKLRADTKLFVNPDLFRGIAAAREVYFEENMAKFKAANPHLR